MALSMWSKYKGLSNVVLCIRKKEQIDKVTYFFRIYKPVKKFSIKTEIGLAYLGANRYWLKE